MTTKHLDEHIKYLTENIETSDGMGRAILREIRELGRAVRNDIAETKPEREEARRNGEMARTI